MNCVQALAVAAAAFVVAGQSWSPRAEARIASLTAETSAFATEIAADLTLFGHACTHSAEPQAPRKLPDSFIHLASRSARL